MILGGGGDGGTVRGGDGGDGGGGGDDGVELPNGQPIIDDSPSALDVT